MLKKLFGLFSSEEVRPSEHDLDLASAALLVEVMRADHEIDPQEQATLTQALTDTFDLSKPEAEALMADAQTLVEASNDLYQFTRIINEQTSEADKFNLLKNLWRVALASNGLDKYEEHLIRRIAELLYIPHGEFIRAKINARESL